MLIDPTLDELGFGAPADDPIVCVFDEFAFEKRGCKRDVKRFLEFTLVLAYADPAASDVFPPSTLVIAVDAVPPDVVVPPDMSLLPRADTSPESEDVFGESSYRA